MALWGSSPDANNNFESIKNNRLSSKKVSKLLAGKRKWTNTQK